MLSEIINIEKEVDQLKINSKIELEQFRLKYLSKKGELNRLFDNFKDLDSDAKKETGKPLNALKQKLQLFFDSTKETLDASSIEIEDKFDKTRPGEPLSTGSLHPITLVMNDMIEIFSNLGFGISYGPEVEDDWHNFSALNFPENHPARDMQDTFFIDKDKALRTHTSSVQVRVMESEKPPIRTISPGRVFRNEAISSRSHCFFHQLEGLYIDENVSFADLKQTLYLFVKRFFGENTQVRFRPSYFPFTEPSAEMDVFLGTTTEADYRITKGTGWLEILGCGMVDTAVLENCNIDSKKYSGFAFGLGIDRIAMYKYGIKDIRLLSENDVRFLKQFSHLS
jgi:phenylalanyl-tRNA synthetase alpha chain